MNKTFKIENALTRIITIECIKKLGHRVYAEVEYLQENKYNVNFYLSEETPYYICSRELKIIENCCKMNFPSIEEIDKILGVKK